MLKPSAFINIQSWMVTELNLSGNELFCYAIIHGFCIDGISAYYGGYQYLAEWLNIDVRSIIRVVNRLVTRGLIEKQQKVINGVITNFFKTIEPQPTQQPDPQVTPQENSLFVEPEVVKESTKEIEKDFNVFWNLYTPVQRNDGSTVGKGSKKVAFKKYVKILNSGEKPENILQGLKNYIAFCQKNNQPTCGVPVFLNQERWKDDYNPLTVMAQIRRPLTQRELQDLEYEQKKAALFAEIDKRLEK